MKKSLDKNTTKVVDLEALPPLNRRVYTLVQRFTSGNVTKFAALLSEGFNEDEKITQQRLEPMFKKRENGLVRGVSSEIVSRILTKFPNVNPPWLLFGQGEVLIERNQAMTAAERQSEALELLNELRSRIDRIERLLKPGPISSPPASEATSGNDANVDDDDDSFEASLHVPDDQKVK